MLRVMRDLAVSDYCFRSLASQRPTYRRRSYYVASVSVSTEIFLEVG